VALGWSPCGKWLAAINANSEILLLNGENGSEIKHWSAHDDAALKLVWHPKRPMFASSCQSGVVKIWELNTDLSVNQIGEISQRSHLDSANWIECLSWRPDGKQLAIASGNGVRLTDVYGTEEAVLTFPGGTVAALAWHPGGSLLGIAGYGGVRICNALDPGGRPIELKWKGSLLSLSWSPDGKFIVAGCQDNTVHLWRFRSQQDVMMSGFQYKPLQLTWVNGGKRLITGGSKTLVLWPFDKKGPEGREPETREYHDQAICALSVASNGKSIASGSRDGRIALWGSSRELKPRTWAMLDSRVEHLQWSPARKSAIVAACSRYGSLYLFDASSCI